MLEKAKRTAKHHRIDGDFIGHSDHLTKLGTSR